MHHGNGTQQLTYEDSTIFYISIHHKIKNFYPGTGNIREIGYKDGYGYNMNIPLSRRQYSDEHYLDLFDKLIIPALKDYNPELIVISSGFDAVMGDLLGPMLVSPECYGQMTSKLMKVCSRLVVQLEGGYNLDQIASCADEVAYALLNRGKFHKFPGTYADQVLMWETGVSTRTTTETMNAQRKIDVERIVRDVILSLKEIFPSFMKVFKEQKMKALKHRVANVPWDPENPDKIRRKSSLTPEDKEGEKDKMEVEPPTLDDMKIQVEKPNPHDAQNRGIKRKGSSESDEQPRKRLCGSFYYTQINDESVKQITKTFELPIEIFMQNNLRILPALKQSSILHVGTKVDISRKVQFPLIKDVVKSKEQKGRMKHMVEWEDDALAKTWEWEESLFPSLSYQIFELKKKLKAKDNAMKETETKLELETTQLKERTTQLQHTQANLDLMEIKYRDCKYTQVVCF